MQVEGKGGRILRSGDRTKRDKNRGRKDKEYIGLVDFKRS